MRNTRKYIIVAGQSNTYYGRNFANTFVADGSLDTGIKQLVKKDSYYISEPAGLSNIKWKNNVGNHVSFSYGLAKKIREKYDLSEITIVPIALGSTSWNTGHWQADGDLYLELIDSIRYIVDVLQGQIEGFFWCQGEGDASVVISNAYKSLLNGLVQTVRDVAEVAGHKDAFKIPFVTFDMVTEWIGSDANRLRVQSALANIGSNMPYTSNIDTTGLPPNTESDIAHYDTRQQQALAERFYNAWNVAKTNDLDVSEPLGETLIYKGGVSHSQKWFALIDTNNSSVVSRLGETFKFRKDKKYRFKIVYTINGNDAVIEFEQSFIPYMFTSINMPASLISSTGSFASGSNQGFAGLTFHQGEECLLKLSTNPTSFWGSLGNVAAVDGGIPFRNIGGNVIAQEVKLYAIT